MLLALAGLIYPFPIWVLGFLIWLAGAALAAGSKQWSRWNKLVGVAGPVILVISGTSVGLALGGQRHSLAAYGHEVLADSRYMIQIAALLGAAYLAWRLVYAGMPKSSRLRTHRSAGRGRVMADAQPGGTGNTISGGTFYGPVIQGRDIQVTASGSPAQALGPAGQAPGEKHVAGHVFISYVRQDSDHVDRLQRALQAAGIPVWRDTADLWPGEDWRAKIRAAITSNTLVFLGCFSSRSLARAKSYQNEELILAIDQLRLRPPEYPWLIPVRFDDCQIPDRDIGAGRTLTSIQRADLFGDHYAQAAQRLVAAILRILGRDSDPAPSQTTPPEQNAQAPDRPPPAADPDT